MEVDKKAIIKSPVDKRGYKIVHLPNGLTAALVHDPQVSSHLIDNPDNGDRQVKNAAVAMCVGVGSFSDPLDAQGLAHLLEHLLCCGTLQFPEQNEWDRYLSTHGGWSNAASTHEYTYHHFHVNGMFLQSALQRFSKFFISPLLKAEAVGTEIEAVHLEFKSRLEEDDQARVWQVQSHTAARGYPLNKFGRGNRESLMSGGNIDFIRKKLQDFFDEFYLGGVMKLAVIGGEPVDTLEGWVAELFGDVRKGIPPNLIFHSEKNVWESGKIYWIASSDDVRELQITWPVPFVNREQYERSMIYLTRLLGHKSGGSIFSLLKRKGWATSVSCGVGRTFELLFTVNIELTNLGLQKVFEVIGIVYQYIRLLVEEGLPEWVYEELRIVNNLNFTYAENSQEELACLLAVNLLLYREEHILYGDNCFEKWNPKLILHILSFLNPQNMRLDMLTKSLDRAFSSSSIQYEPWSGVPYCVEDIPSSFFEDWKNSSFRDKSLHLPPRNDYIPTYLSIRNTEGLKDRNHEIPKCIVDDKLMRIWHKEDKNVPNANAYFLITFQVRHWHSTLANVLTDMYASLLSDALGDMFYQAQAAGLHPEIYRFDKSMLRLNICGYSEKLPILASNILKFAKTFLPTEQDFEMARDTLEMSYINKKTPEMNKLSCLLSLSFLETIAFISEMFMGINIQGLCHGNLSKRDVIHIAYSFIETFKSSLPLEFQVVLKKPNLPHGVRYLRNLDVKNKSDVNSFVEIYYIICPISPKPRVMAQLFQLIAYEPFFNELRTKQRLGYSLHCFHEEEDGVIGFSFTIKSSEYNPQYLHERIDAFINGKLAKILAEMDDEEFESYRSALLERNKKQNCSFDEETKWYWDQIVKGAYLFEEHELELEELKILTKADIVGWYNYYLNPKSSHCTRMSTLTWGCNSRNSNQLEI